MVARSVSLDPSYDLSSVIKPPSRYISKKTRSKMYDSRRRIKNTFRTISLLFFLLFFLYEEKMREKKISSEFDCSESEGETFPEREREREKREKLQVQRGKDWPRLRKRYEWLRERYSSFSRQLWWNKFGGVLWERVFENTDFSPLIFSPDMRGSKLRYRNNSKIIN